MHRDTPHFIRNVPLLLAIKEHGKSAVAIYIERESLEGGKLSSIGYCVWQCFLSLISFSEVYSSIFAAHCSR